MNAGKIAFLTGASLLFMSGAALAQDEVLSQTEAQSFRGASASAPGQSGKEKVANLLRANGKAADTLVQTGETKGRAGRKHLVFEQYVDGLRVHGAQVKAAVGADGELLVVSERTAPNGRAVGRNPLSAEAALDLALRVNHAGRAAAPGQVGKAGNTTTFAKTDFFHAEPTVEAVMVARKNGALERGWLVTTWSEADNQLIETLIDGRGKVADTQNRTSNDSYNVFADHPGVSQQRVEQGPGTAGNAQSPAGWLFGGTQYATLISGNNVRAYLDRNNSNTPDTPSRVVTDGNFVTPANLSQSATTTANQEVAVQNLFWLNNVIHDALYSYGFTESARNFQEDNFGRGGAGSDSVEAQAQDGGGTNNANFATPSDGSNPRMQMYLWTYTSPGRDGDLDSDIVWHEYGHGLTWRMIGSMSGAMSGAIGEGMSDVLAIIHNDDDRVGEYSTNDSAGIRSARYTNYPRTMADFTGSSVHFDGEIYAAAMWDVWTNYKAAGHGVSVVMSDIVDGMNFTPAAPHYLQMRDGILDATPDDRDCLVWDGFAQHGMGAGASIGVKGRRYTFTESTALPTACGGTGGGGGGGDTGGGGKPGRGNGKK